MGPSRGPPTGGRTLPDDDQGTRRSSSTATSPPCCSPTSRGRRRSRPRSAMLHGGPCSNATTTSCVEGSPGIAAPRWTRRATGSSPPSTVRPAPFAVRSRSARGFGARHRHPGGCPHRGGADDRWQGRRHRSHDRFADHGDRREIRGGRVANGEGLGGRKRSRLRRCRGTGTEGRPRPVASLPGRELAARSEPATRPEALTARPPRCAPSGP